MWEYGVSSWEKSVNCGNLTAIHAFIDNPAVVPAIVGMDHLLLMVFIHLPCAIHVNGQIHIHNILSVLHCSSETGSLPEKHSYGRSLFPKGKSW